MAESWVKSLSPQQQRVAIAVLKKLISGVFLVFHVSNSSSFLVSLLLPPLPVPSAFHPSPALHLTSLL